MSAGARAERDAKRVAKARAKEVSEKLRSNEWIDIEGFWAAVAIEGRGHRDGPHYGRKYRVKVPLADFRDVRIHTGMQVRFTDIQGGNGHIYTLPTIDLGIGTPIVFEFEIHPDATGGLMISVDGMQVRAFAPSTGDDDDEDEGDLNLYDEPPHPWLPFQGGGGGAGGSAGLVA